jgi:hypothetical protein
VDGGEVDGVELEVRSKPKRARRADRVQPCRKADFYGAPGKYGGGQHRDLPAGVGALAGELLA